MKDCFIGAFLLFSTSSFSQNLIPNSTFELNGEPNCEGWHAGCCIPLANRCDTLETDGMTMIYNVAPDSIRGYWGIELYGSYPSGSSIYTYLPAIEGTHVYKLTFWMNSINFGGGGGIGLLKDGSSGIKWVEDFGQPWTQYTLLDTITAALNDTLLVGLCAGIGDFCICDVQYDQPELEIIDSLPTNSNNLTEEASFSIWPNPIHNFLHIKSSLPFSFSLDLFDFTGKILIHHYPMIDQTSIDLVDLMPGIYFYTITGKGEIINSGKLLKL